MKRFIKPLLYLVVIAGILFMINSDLMPNKSVEEISYTEFLGKAEYGDIERIEINGDTIKAYPYNSSDYLIVEYIDNQEFVQSMRDQEIEVTRTSSSSGFNIFPFLIMLLFLSPVFIAMWNMSRLTSTLSGGDEDSNNGIGGMFFNSGKSKSKFYKQDVGIKFTDVAGQEEAKESLTEIIDYLHNADKYSSIGAKLPKGALLIGPPGTGKTLLAKAVAGEANVPFYSITGSDFVEMFVGVGASRVREMFSEAKKSAPCIIFIDEIDAIGKSRGGSVRTGTNDEREQTLNQLLSEMDGFDSTTAVVVIAATNRPEILDKALTRPGRFDRRIIVDKPDLKGREDILKVHAKNVNMDESVDLSAIAKATAGGVGADLSNIINEAALRAVRMNRSLVSQEDLMESVEIVFAGKEKKDRVLGENERKIVAYHEVGHAVVAALQKNSEPVQKITIVPRTSGALGYTMQVPEEEKFLSSKEELLEEIRTLIGGRCAEEVFFNTVTTGASNDIEKITKLAKEMVTVYGMNSQFDMVGFETQESIYLNENAFRTCSETYSAVIDAEMIKTVKACHMEVSMMLIENADLVNEVAEVLLEKENITGSEFMEIFRKYHDESYSWNPTVSPDDVKTAKVPMYTASLQPHTESLETPAVKTLPASKKPKFEAPKPLKKDNKEDKPKVVIKTDSKEEQKPKETAKPDDKKDVDKDKQSVQKNDTKEEKLINDDREEAQSQNKIDNPSNKPADKPKDEPEAKEDIPEAPLEAEENTFEAPSDSNFEDDILAAMDFDDSFDVPDAFEEPPAPDFDSMFDDDKKDMPAAEKPKQTKVEDSKPKEETKPKEDSKQKEEPKTKEEQKTKPAFEAPKPLKKKNKKGNTPQKQKPEQKTDEAKQNDEKSAEKQIKKQEQSEHPRNDMALLMNSLKTNPEELAQRKKKAKYINPNGQEKKQNHDILSPESNLEDFKKQEPVNYDLGKSDDAFSEDDY